MSEADIVHMAQCLALSELVGAYFALESKWAKSWYAFVQMPQFFFFNVKTVYFACMMQNIFYTSIL